MFTFMQLCHLAGTFTKFSSLLLLRYLSVVLHVSLNEPWRRLHSLRVYERQECQAFTWTAAQWPASLFACSDNHWIYLEPREALNKKGNFFQYLGNLRAQIFYITITKQHIHTVTLLSILYVFSAVS